VPSDVSNPKKRTRLSKKLAEDAMVVDSVDPPQISTSPIPSKAPPKKKKKTAAVEIVQISDDPPTRLFSPFSLAMAGLF
jgi:hypothetical protein